MTETGTEPVAVATRLPTCYRKRFHIRVELLLGKDASPLLTDFDPPGHWLVNYLIPQKESIRAHLLYIPA
jgi:hypothetical protein